MRKHLKDVAIGILILAICWIVEIPLILIMLVWTQVGILLFTVMLPVAALVVYGLYKRRFAMALSPFILAVLWQAVAIGLHARAIALVTAPEVSSREVPQPAFGHRTLILNNDAFNLSLLANGVVDRIVHQYARPHGPERYATWLGQGAECRLRPTEATLRLWAVGRYDECFITQRIGALPDSGLVLTKDRVSRFPFGRCCEELAFSVRENGQNRHVGSWSRGRVLIPLYLPSFWPGHSRFEIAWSNGGNKVFSGAYWAGADFSIEQALEMIFAMPPGQPFRPTDDTPERTIANAYARMQEAGNQNKILEHLRQVVRNVQMRQDGYVDSRSHEIMATAVLHGYRTDPVFLDFVSHLEPEQQVRIAEEVLAILGDPANADKNDYSRFETLPGAVGPGWQDRMLAFFRDRPDLGVWQYQAAANIYLRTSAEGASTIDAADAITDLGARLFDVLENDRTDDFGSRIIAFCRVIRWERGSDRHKLFVADNLARLTDRQFYFMLTGGRATRSHCKTADEATAQSQIVRAFIARASALEEHFIDYRVDNALERMRESIE